eukprot:CAMPEP_0194670272 /NCGR_PEP_ID=MMETSP0295-20121207/5101_1 /TAXON_ID=39354 /ORGANISM="Heterosigma akashiwo, Strain CCMP2393" /LENGTH=105 /DNA_ID=CAMNT_0039553459 /DNA_START=146 /DNA_END=464 /DNA_ORIENTATION=-
MPKKAPADVPPVLGKVLGRVQGLGSVWQVGVGHRRQLVELLPRGVVALQGVAADHSQLQVEADAPRAGGGEAVVAGVHPVHVVLAEIAGIILKVLGVQRHQSWFP